MKVAFQATPMDVRGMLGKVWGSLIVCMPSNGGVMLRPGCSRFDGAGRGGKVGE
jgi:hypothetical protein